MEEENMSVTTENTNEVPTWEFMVQSPTLEQVSCKYKLKLKYGGYFRLAKYSSRKRYCFGYQKCVYIDTLTYGMKDLVEEVTNRYPSNRGLNLSIWFVDKNDTDHSFIQLVSDENFESMLHMYEMEKELTIYVTTNDNGETNTTHERVQNEVIDEPNGEEAFKYISENHNKIWSRSKFGTTSKCDYITNNISEAFNSWIGELRYQPVLDLLNSIREKIMIRFDKKRTILKTWKGKLVPTTKSYLNKISKNLGEYEVCRSSERRAEVKFKDTRWEVLLDEQTCTCRVWQVKGLPCVHAAAFIAFTREVNWDQYVDSYYTIEKYKAAYALEIAPMPAKDQWIHIDGEKIYPPTIKCPPGRPRKNRIKAHDESKKRHKCKRCKQYGHHAKTCKNPEENETSTSKRGRVESTNN